MALRDRQRTPNRMGTPAYREMSWPRCGSLLVTAWLGAWLPAMGVPEEPAGKPVAIEPLAVVTRETSRLELEGATVAVLPPGEVLTAYSTYQSFYAARHANGQRGWIRREAVVPFQEAVEVFTRVLEQKPQDGMTYTLRGSAYWSRGERQKALDDYDRAIECGLRDPAVLEQRGMFRALSGDAERAIADYTETLRQEPQRVSAFANRAAAYLATGKHVEAIRDLDEVLKREPARAAAFYQRAVAKKNLGQLADAIRDFTRAIEIAPEYVEAWNGRGFAHFQRDEHEPAVADFSRAIELDPQSALAYNNRGYNLFLLGRHQEALADYSRAVRLAPEYALAYQNVAWLWATADDPQFRDGRRAVIAATKACELRGYKEPDDIKALAVACAVAGDFESARKWQRRVVELVPKERKAEEQSLLERYLAGQPWIGRVTSGRN